MEIWGKIFLILSSGLFLLLFMLLIEHPRRNLIGWVLFGVITLSIIGDGWLIAIILAILSSPFLIFLDAKQIGWKKALLFAGLTVIVIAAFYQFIINWIPLYMYPILVFVYSLIARASYLMTRRIPETNPE